MARRPVPETRTALLVSEGYKTIRKPTPHTYVRTDQTEYRPSRRLPDEEPGGKMWVFVFACAETGTERRWGSEVVYKRPAARKPAPVVETVSTVRERIESEVGA